MSRKETNTLDWNLLSFSIYTLATVNWKPIYEELYKLIERFTEIIGHFSLHIAGNELINHGISVESFARSVLT